MPLISSDKASLAFHYPNYVVITINNKKDWIEDLIVRKTVAMLSADEVIDDIVKKLLALQEKDSSELPYYERELADTENSIDNLLNAIQQGILTKSTKERLEELESRKEQLEILIAEEKMIKPKLSEEFIRFYLMKFRSLDMAKLAHRKILIETFVNSVYIFDDKLVITYNADEKTETVTLEEINASIIECSGAPIKKIILLDGLFCLPKIRFLIYDIVTLTTCRLLTASQAFASGGRLSKPR